MAMKHAQSATPSARTINSAVPAGLDDVVRRSMAKDPADRYADAGDMLEDLRRIEDNVRFGKGAAGAKTQPVKQVIVAPSDPEAPKMAEKPRAERKEVEEREPGDVPIWMIVSFTFVLAVAVALIGVWWFFNTNAPKIVKVPEVRGKMRSDAEQILNRRKLQLRIAGRESSEKLPADTVLKVDPEPGQQVREGGTVAVTLSTGSRMVTLPDLRGKSQEEARQILTKLNLDLDGVNTMQDEKLASGLIGRQAPGPKSKVERFTRVNIWVSSGPSQPPRTNPTAAEARYLYTMRIRLTRITNPVVLKVEITDAKGTRQIYEAEHYPNEDVTVRTEGYGPEAVFRIYYDGELVSQVTKRADEGSPAGAGDTAGGTTGDTTGDNGDGNP
jgi:serine/threonine-protein kinase